MTTPELIRACAQSARKPFLVIGGHAVIAHGYARNTIDVDLLVCTTDRDAWLSALAGLDYRPRHLHENFAQLSSEGGAIDLDLMFVKEATFTQMHAASMEVSFGPTAARVPSLEHLVALKLHVLKQGLEHRTIGDLDDVINLAIANRVDLHDPKWQELFARYGTPEIYEKVRHAAEH